MNVLLNNRKWSLGLFFISLLIIHTTCTPSGNIARETNLIPFVDFQSIPEQSIKLYFHTLFFDMRMLDHLVSTGVVLGMLGNVILFFPFGFFLAGLVFQSPVNRKYLLILTVGFMFSLSIEVIQLFIVTRTADIDDLILNTLGTTLGTIIFHLLNTVYFPAKRE